MHFTHLSLRNWRNFREVDVDLESRVFVLGANASGKSNLLDVFRFLRDVAEPKGGLVSAIEQREGVSQLRSLHARAYPNVMIEVEVELERRWSYQLEFNQDKLRRLSIKKERVVRDGKEILLRPNDEDRRDSARLVQTHLEQVNANKEFRELARFFSEVRYLHIVPQLVREPDRSVGKSRDPFGGDFLEQLARTPEKTRSSRLRRINQALQVAVPHLVKLELKRDESTGMPHLKGLYEHWRPRGGWQTEKQLSDGTLRLLGLLWAFLDGRSPLLLEEPELSLHSAVVRQIPQMLGKLAQRSGRQILLSTHSADLLSDPGIPLSGVLLLEPTSTGTRVSVASEHQDIIALVEAGQTIADAALPRIAPRKNFENLDLFAE